MICSQMKPRTRASAAMKRERYFTALENLLEAELRPNGAEAGFFTELSIGGESGNKKIKKCVYY